jgi:hypothetical protein
MWLSSPRIYAIPQEFGKIVDNVLEVVMLRDVGAVKFTEASAEVRLILSLFL